MKITQPIFIHRIALVLAILVTIALIVETDAVGEEAGGSLTGPLAQLSAFGALFLLIALAPVGLGWRVATPLVTLGVAATVPWQSWRLFPGVWCDVLGDCSTEPLLARFDTWSVAALVFGSIAVLLTLIAKRT